MAGCSLVTDLDGLRGSGGADAAPDAVASACSGHILCESFDHDGGWASSWVPQSSAATMEVATDDFVSPPASLRITSTGADARAVLLGTFPSPLPTDFACSVSVRVEGFPAGHYNRVAPVVLYDIADPTLLDYEATFMGVDQSGYLDEHVESNGDAGWTDDGRPLPYSIVDGAWHRLTLTVHLGASPSAQLDLDGKTGIGATKPLTPPSPVSGIAFAVGLASSNGGPSGWVAHFDDAVCDAQ